jgi:hypothetical protein
MKANLEEVALATGELLPLRVLREFSREKVLNGSGPEGALFTEAWRVRSAVATGGDVS